MFYSSCMIQENNHVDQTLLSQVCVINVKEITKEVGIKKNKENPVNAIE